VPPRSSADEDLLRKTKDRRRTTFTRGTKMFCDTKTTTTMLASAGRSRSRQRAAHCGTFAAHRIRNRPHIFVDQCV
jgi:hypothetical protein